MRTCCIYPVGMATPTKQPPAADRVYSHIKQGVLDRRYEGGTLLTEGELAEAVGSRAHLSGRRCSSWRWRA